MHLAGWGTRGNKSEIRFRKYHGTEGKKLNPHAYTPATKLILNMKIHDKYTGY
jgi:hypothetical protein